MLITASLQVLASDPQNPARQPKPWNVCASGHQLPATPIRWQAFDNGESSFKTPHEPKAVVKIKGCAACQTVLMDHIAAKITAKYGFNETTNSFAVEPPTAAFLLNTDGELEECVEEETTLKEKLDPKPATPKKIAAGAAVTDK